MPNYTILLILTDGIINDMQNTMNLLVLASKMAISVIIIGVGNADFSDMEKLDGDQIAIVDDKGNKAVRDCVQFVKFNSAKD